MSTKATVSRLADKVKRMHGLKEMKSFTYWEIRTPEALQDFYDAEERLSETLDEYYAGTLMLSLVEKPDIYEMYINLHKEEAKRRLLRQLIKVKETTKTNELVIKRLNDLIQEKKQISKNPLKKTRTEYLKKTIARLEVWAKDLNYEERKGEIRYKQKE